jgi:hypothetical protein
MGVCERVTYPDGLPRQRRLVGGSQEGIRTPFAHRAATILGASGRHLLVALQLFLLGGLLVGGAEQRNESGVKTTAHHERLRPGTTA